MNDQFATAKNRVSNDTDLAPHADLLIEYEWDNDEEHLEWVATADKAEILSWVASIRKDIEIQNERDAMLDEYSRQMNDEEIHKSI